MTKREVIGRYRGSVFGILWSLFNPILLLIVYTFVFSIIFKARWGVDLGGGKSEFAMILFAGMITHALFAECVNRAPTLILGNANYVKKVVFPLEILPWIAMGSALFHALISVFVLVVFNMAINMSVHLTSILFPLTLLPLIIFTMGVSWFLASLGVYLRDLGHVIGLFTTILLFLSPIFYPVSAVPEEYRWAIYLNPLTFIIEQMRATLLWGKPPDFAGLGVYLAVSMIVAWVGFWWFQRTRRGFADVV